MDYYEELGLSRSASAADIRHAYKQLVKLLHPDHCADESLRALAELQMKRWNAILEVLTDEDARAQYDRQSLVVAPPENVISLPFGAWRRWLWPAVAGAAVLAVILFFRPSRPNPGFQPQAVTSATSPAVTPEKRTNSSKRPHRTLAMRADPPPEDGPEIGLPQESPLAVPSVAEIRNAADEVHASRSVPGTAAKPPSTPMSTKPQGLAGNWFFVPAARVRNDGLYPAEYIELRISERSGVLHGRYRASYRVKDQAISPRVSFEFDGSAGPDGASLPWVGAGGARGDVTLRLLAGGALEITWVANQLGSELGLISGTATLVRRVE